MTESDALRIFNLQAGCSAEQVRQAYLDLVKVWHPDRFQSDGRLSARAERELQEINEAYTLLQSVMAGTHSSSSSAGASSSRPAYAQPRPPDPAPSAHDHTTASQMPLVKTVIMGVGLGLAVAAAVTVFMLMTRAPGIATDESSTVDSPPTVGATSAAAPERVVAPPPRPESGTELLDVQRRGGGSLVVNNASRRDAVVALTTALGHERAVYVRAGEQVTLANVATGTYQVQMMVGRDWTRDRFTREVGYQELEQPVQFVENSDGDTTEFTKLTVSLQPTIAGMRGIRTARPFRISSPQEQR